jgi:hypothetical protein
MRPVSPAPRGEGCYAIWADLEDDIGSTLEDENHVRQPFREQIARIRIFATEADVPPEGVALPPLRELAIVGDQRRRLVGGVDGLVVIAGERTPGLIRRPTVVTGVPDNSSSARVDIVVEKEPHDAIALARLLASAMSAAARWGKALRISSSDAPRLM